MTKRILKSVFLLALTPTLGAIGCDDAEGGTGMGPDSGGGKADEADDVDPADFACAEAFSDESRRSDRGDALTRLASLNDPFARAVLKDPAEGCPRNANELIDKLKVTDGENCTNESGMRTALVSELGQHTDEEGKFRVDDPGYRAVAARQCGDRKPWELVLSFFGANEDSLPQAPEVIAYDSEAGVFNYYVLEQSGWAWHGNSIDAIEGTNRCGNCHDGGGLIQKELDSPWVHWEHFDEINGAEKFFEKFGDKIGPDGALDGASVETSIVEPSTIEYTKKGRIPILLGEQGGSPDLVNLLRPLFCTPEINLQSGGNTSDDGDVTFRTDFFLAREFASGDPNVFDFQSRNNGSVRLTGEVYNAAMRDIGQSVRGVPGEVDTHRRLTYPERSFADAAAVAEMISRGVLDKDLVSDVLMVDFTQPIFSEARCGLLEEAADNGAFESFDAPEDVTAAALREALADALVDSNAPGAQELVAALGDSEDGDAHKKRRDDFIAACNARLTQHPDEMVADLMRVHSWRKTQAAAKTGPDSRGPKHIIEDPNTMIALDDLDARGSEFDEACCVSGRTCSPVDGG